MARFYSKPAPVVVKGSSFDWGDAGIGATRGFVLAVFVGTAIVFVRNSRRTKLAL